MARIITLIMALVTVLAVNAETFSYKFNSTPLSKAILKIAEEHPDIDINFIYNELENYKTNATVRADNPYDALRQAIGLNPVTVVKSKNTYYIEALQHGKFCYTGQVVGSDNEPVIGVTVMLLTPKDSTVITYGVTDNDGRFSIPCDRNNILAKFTCLGLKTLYINRPRFDMGTLTMTPLPLILSTVSVEADNTVFTSDKNIYMPSSVQKNASQDATDLLRRMSIPQLVINPLDNNVKDVFGNGVPIFINYQEAQQDELIGMKMTDVRRIEYLEFPTDPRFKGEQRAINFIVQEYEYGGYTKVAEAFSTLNGIFNNTNAFSRFTYKKMTYDIFAGSNNQDYKHNGSDNSSIYRLMNNDIPVNVTRIEKLIKSDTRINSYPLTLRASYFTPRLTIRNTLSFTHSSSPTQYSMGDLSLNRDPADNYIYNRSSPTRYNNLYFNSNVGGFFGANGSFDITPSFLHTHRNNVAFYESTLMSEPVNNSITENAYNWGIQATGRLSFTGKNQLSLFFSGGQNINKLIYNGTNDINDNYSSYFIVGVLRYRYQTQRINITPSLGFSLVRNSLNGIVTSDVAPRIGFSTWVQLNRKSQVSAYMYYQTTSPDIDSKVNDIVQSNEYMYLTGNPYLKDWRNLNSNLSYNWFHGNSFSMTAFAGYNRDFNRMATVYSPYNDGKALLRSFVNDGSFIHYYVGLSFNSRLFNNSLQLYGNITQNAYAITGKYKDSYYPLRIQFQASYYWKAFNILASWGNSQRSLTENSNYIIRGRNFYMLSIGWGNGIWAINISARNIFNKGWRSETWEKSTPLYSEKIQFYNPSAHPSINLSLTYTIGYGKKIERGNEVGSQNSAPSAIIK